MSVWRLCMRRGRNLALRLGTLFNPGCGRALRRFFFYFGRRCCGSCSGCGLGWRAPSFASATAFLPASRLASAARGGCLRRRFGLIFVGSVADVVVDVVTRHVLRIDRLQWCLLRLRFAAFAPTGLFSSSLLHTLHHPLVTQPRRIRQTLRTYQVTDACCGPGTAPFWTE